MILTAPSCPESIFRTSLTVEQPPLPTVLPSCHRPIFLFLPELVVEDALEISESRLELRLDSLTMAVMRLPAEDSAGLLRAIAVLVSFAWLWGTLRGEDAACADLLDDSAEGCMFDR